MIAVRSFLLAASLLAFLAGSVTAQIGFPVPGPGRASTAVVPIGTPASVYNNFVTGTTGTSDTYTTTGTVATGDLVVIAVAQNQAATARTVSSVADSAGNTYTQATTSGLIGSQAEGSLWYKANATAMAIGGTITVTWSGATSALNAKAVQAIKISTGIAASPLDKVQNAGSVSSSSASLVTATLSQANEIAIGVSAVFPGTQPAYTQPSGFTNALTLAVTGNGPVNLDYKVTSATTAVTYAPAWGSAGINVEALATFKGN